MKKFEDLKIGDVINVKKMYNYDDCHWHYPSINDIFVVISKRISALGFAVKIRNFNGEGKTYLIRDKDFISYLIEEEIFLHIMES